MENSKHGKLLGTRGDFLIREALPDSAVYNRGFVIGGKILKRSSKGTWDPPLETEEEPDSSTERIKSTNKEEAQ